MLQGDPRRIQQSTHAEVMPPTLSTPQSLPLSQESANQVSVDANMQPWVLP